MSRQPDGKTEPIKPEDVQSWLGKQPSDALVEIIMQQALADKEFFNILKFKVAAESPSVNTGEMRAVLRQAMTIKGFISWRESSAYSRGVERVIERIREMLDTHPQEVMELVEYGLELWEEAIQSIDDSNGCMGMILDELHELHLKACERARPEPVALAERLFARHVNSGWDIFWAAYKNYGKIFGEKGKARFRELAEAEWSKLPHFGPGEKNEERYGRAFKLRTMMLEFAEEAGDLNRIVEILTRDLSELHDYKVVAERCRQAGDHELALYWAEQGVRAFPDARDTRLHLFLADEYLRGKRTEDAVRVIWSSFEASPDLTRYQALSDYAMKAGTWPAWREKALQLVRKNIAGQKAIPGGNRSYSWAPQQDHSLLVEIFLSEKDAEAAWIEAQQGGCRESLWLQLAGTREQEHPEDAIAIYRRQIGPALERKSKQSYLNAVGYLEKIRKLMVRMGREAEFNKELLAIKSEWKRLRNFIQCIERTTWGKGA